MIERREHLRFAAEPRQSIRIAGQERRQDFQRDVAIELGVARAIDLAHTPGAERGEDLIRAESSAGRQRQGWHAGRC